MMLDTGTSGQSRFHLKARISIKWLSAIGKNALPFLAAVSRVLWQSEMLWLPQKNGLSQEND